MHLSRVVLIALAFVSASASAALAQYAEWTGRILDPTGAAIPKATVSVVSKEKGLTRDTTSDDQGEYFLSALRPGEYLVKVQAAGFETASQDHIKLEADRRTVLDITLQVARLANEDLTVKGDATRVDVAAVDDRRHAARGAQRRRRRREHLSRAADAAGRDASRTTSTAASPCAAAVRIRTSR